MKAPVVNMKRLVICSLKKMQWNKQNSALRNHQKATNIAQSIIILIQSSFNAAKMMEKAANISISKTDNDGMEASRLFEKSGVLFVQDGKLKRAAELYQKAALEFSNRKNTKEAIKFYQQACDLYKLEGNYLTNCFDLAISYSISISEYFIIAN